MSHACILQNRYKLIEDEKVKAPIILSTLAFLIVIVAVPIYAQNELPGGVLDLNSFLRSVLSALITGSAISLLGYFKSTDPKGFVLRKLIATLLVSICIGLVMVSLGWNYNTPEQWLASSTLTIWIYWLAKIIGKFAISAR